MPVRTAPGLEVVGVNTLVGTRPAHGIPALLLMQRHETRLALFFQAVVFLHKKLKPA